MLGFTVVPRGRRPSRAPACSAIPRPSTIRLPIGARRQSYAPDPDCTLETRISITQLTCRSCHNVGKMPSDIPAPENFGQIDFLLLSRDWLDSLTF
eukprot:8866055-Pyramimonas_sp.AAC.1